MFSCLYGTRFCGLQTRSYSLLQVVIECSSWLTKAILCLTEVPRRLGCCYRLAALAGHFVMSKISVAECRRILGNTPLSDEQVEELRDALHGLSNTLIDCYIQEHPRQTHSPTPQ